MHIRLYTVTIPEVIGAEYSFDDATYSQTRTTTANPGDTVEGFIRYAGTAELNTSPATSSQLTLSVPVTSIEVSGAGDATSITTNGGTLQMSANVLPANASNKAVTWSIASGSGSTISVSGQLIATANGTVTVRATAADGFGVYGEKAITISGQTPPSVPVTSITVTGTGGATSITTKGGTLQMLASVLPTNASNKAITWSIVNGSGATISTSGLLTATANGTATVRATATDGTGVYGEKTITISGQGTVPPTTYALTVQNGTGGGSFAAGTAVTITANAAPSGQVFDKWIGGNGGTIANANNATTTFTMPANAATVTATYKASGNGGTTTSPGGGSSGGSGGGGGSVSNFTPTPPATWLTTPNKDGKPSTSTGQSGVKAADWKKLGKTPYTHDTLDGKAVQVRVIINDPSQFSKDTLLSGYAKGKDVDNTRNYFEKWFKNKVRSIHFDQQTDWEQPVRIAAKVDLKGMDTSSLILYSYDAKANSYRQIKNPNHHIDANGYLWFTTPHAGKIIVSEGALQKK